MIIHHFSISLSFVMSAWMTDGAERKEQNENGRIEIQMLSTPMSERNMMGLSCTVPNWLSRHKCIVAVIVILMTNLLWLKSWKSRRAKKKNAKKKRNKTWKKVTSHFCTQRAHNLFCVRVRVWVCTCSIRSYGERNLVESFFGCVFGCQRMNGRAKCKLIYCLHVESLVWIEMNTWGNDDNDNGDGWCCWWCWVMMMM